MRFVILAVLALGWLTGCEQSKKLADELVEKHEEHDAKVTPAPTPPKGDAKAGQKIAAAQCFHCHGLKGNEGAIGAPFIGGQHYDYLITSLTAYTSGLRNHEDMKKAVQALQPADLVNVATYYAGLDQNGRWDASVADPSVRRITVNTATIAAGRDLAKPCAACHGPDGVSTRAGSPSLAGMHADYFAKTIHDFFNGNRRHEIMANFRYSLSDEKIEHLAAYYTSLKPRKTSGSITGDTAAGRQVAAERCAGCHGPDGNSVTPTMPSLAGQDAEYLVSQTQQYRDGRRKNSLMHGVVAHLKDRDIVNAAAYFASQKPQHARPDAGMSAQEFNPVADGERIAKSCNGCHGPDGISEKPGIPSLVAMTPEYLGAAIRAYKKGERQHAMMKTLVENLSAADIENVGLYYATREPRGTGRTGRGNAAQGDAQSQPCAGCHGADGNAGDPLTPSLAGQDAGYLLQACADYTAGKRMNQTMKDALANVPRDQLANITTYYATQKPSRLLVRMPEPPDVLAQRCDKCHGPGGLSSDPAVPRLTGQVEAYMVRVLKEYVSGDRNSTAMHAMSDVLTQYEIRAIATHYAKQKAR